MKRNGFTVVQIIRMIRDTEVRVLQGKRVTFRPHSSLKFRPPAPEATPTKWTLHTSQGDPFSIPRGQVTIPPTQQVVHISGAGQLGGHHAGDLWSNFFIPLFSWLLAGEQ